MPPKIPNAGQLTGAETSIVIQNGKPVRTTTQDIANKAPTNTGPKGDTGPQGPAGTKGDKGDAGAVGAQGAAGLAGPKGDTGPTGPMGQTGATGAKGDTGAAGAVGPTGATGVAGAAGAQGVKGDIGATGAQGPAGFGTVSPSTPTRVLGTAFQPHATKAVLVTYSVKTQVTNPLLAGTSTATVKLLSDASNPPTTERARAEATNGVGLSVSVALTTSNTSMLSYLVPPGHWVLIHQSGSGTFANTIVNQAEETLG